MNTKEMDFLKGQLENKLFLTEDEVSQCCQFLQLTVQDLLLACLEIIKQRAVAHLSNFAVGAAALGESGKIYFGANQDFTNTTTHFCIHAEQAAVYIAYLCGEKKLTHIAVNAAPCGYCRQFFVELAYADELVLLFPNNNPVHLNEILPYTFGPRDLGVTGGMLDSPLHEIKLVHPSDDELTLAALQAAQRSYSPYWNVYSGIAIQSDRGDIFYGSYLSTAAQNPDLLPIQAALVHLVQFGHGYTYADIKRVVLVESSNAVMTQQMTTQILLDAVNSKVQLECYYY